MSPPILPIAPRAPRWSAVSRVPPRVALLILSIVLLPIAAAIGMRIKGIDVLGTIDPALDAERSFTEGRIEAATAFDIGLGGPHIALDFVFRTADGQVVRGRSFATPPAHPSTGDRVTIEYATHSPDVARVQGTRCNPYEPYMSRFIGFAGAPAVFLLLLWLRDSTRRRSLLTNGRETRLEILESTPTARATLLRYRYADQHGIHHAQRTRVARSCALQTELSRNADRVRVVHDESEPRRHRLVTTGDFIT